MEELGEAIDVVEKAVREIARLNALIKTIEAGCAIELPQRCDSRVGYLARLLGELDDYYMDGVEAVAGIVMLPFMPAEDDEDTLGDVLRTAFDDLFATVLEDPARYLCHDFGWKLVWEDPNTQVGEVPSEPQTLEEELLEACKRHGVAFGQFRLVDGEITHNNLRTER